jgi:Leucine-rich repeat (LRR) protein
MPYDIICEIILFNPDSMHALKAVSRTFRENSEILALLKKNIVEIQSWCSSTRSPLANFLARELASTHLETQSCRLLFQFHISLAPIIRYLGAIPLTECPNRILLAHEVPPFNSRVETAQNMNLERAWRKIRWAILDANPESTETPAVGARAQEIRIWMQKGGGLPLLQRITKLYLRDCGLTSIPEEIGLCTGLEELYLDDNQITSLPEGIFRELKNLKWLSLSSNRITSLSGEIFRGLTALQGLFLSHNQLTSLPEGIFQELIALRSLFLSANQLTSLSGEIFRGLTALQVLSLCNNQLTSLPGEIFRGLTALYDLSLSHNQLSSLPEGIFQKLTTLQTLCIASNNLTSFPEGIFQDLSALTALLLQGNRMLTSFPREAFQRLTALQTLVLLNTTKLLFSYKEIGIESRLIIDEFFNYICMSQFAVLYQLAAGNAPVHALEASFSKLPMTIQDALYKRVLEERESSWKVLEWDELYLFKDIPHFCSTLKKFVTENFEALSQEQKTVVYGHVFYLAKNQGVAVDRNDPRWGEDHAFDNVLRLIDAMWCMSMCFLWQETEESIRQEPEEATLETGKQQKIS